MSTTFPTKVAGNLLATTTIRGLAGERRHLFRMHSGEYSLVRSWLTWCPHLGTRRVYSVDNLIGSHPTLQEALDRFDAWDGF